MDIKLKVGDVIDVHGFVMLKGIEGSLKVLKIDDISYYFTRPKGKKVVARHYFSDIDRWVDTNISDINYITKQLTP